MNSLRSALVFLTGIATGVMITVSCVGHGSAAWAGARSTAPFRDIPANHAAAKAVATMTAAGIVAGFPDDTYRGAKPVTRYELAVVLARFAKYYDTSKQPLASAHIALPPAPTWSAHSRQYLASNGFVPASSDLFSNPGSAFVTANLLADTLSSTVDRLTDRSLPVDQN